MPHFEFNFENKVVWVTGTSQGIGKAIAEAFLSLGATVIGIDKQPQDKWPHHLKWHAVQLDIRDHEAVKGTVTSLLKDWPVIDVLINAAGILKMGETAQLSEQDWLDTFAVNVHGPFFLCHHLIPVFKKQQHGNIVNIGSNAAHVPRLKMAAYCASKAALTHLSHTMALELASANVRCNLVSPGSTDTPMQRAMWQDEQGERNTIAGNMSDYKLAIPLNKIAQPHEIAQTVVFLASPLASHITMQDVVVDGAATLGA